MFSWISRLAWVLLASATVACAASTGGAPNADRPGEDSDSDAVAGQGETAAQPLPTHPNIVFLLGEARGWTSTSTLEDASIPDSRSAMFQTPNLDTLASQGLTFSNFYAPSPRCMPSRAAVLTGKSPARLHMTFIPEGNKDGTVTGDVIPPITVTTLPTSEVTVASMLRGAGYATAHFGKWHVGNLDPTEYGFDTSDGPTTNKGPAGEEHPNPAEAYGTTDRGIAFMRTAVADGKPFFLQISAYGGGDEVDSLPDTYAAELTRLPGVDPKDVAESAVIRDMDTTVGTLLDALRELGIEDNTYVVFSSDHGRAGRAANAPLEQGKGSVWEGGIRVPLFVRGPGIEPGTRSSVRATQVDLLPTFAALAHVDGPLPADVEGGDLSALWLGTGTSVSRPTEEFVVHFPHYDKDPLGPASTILLGDEKLIRFWEDGSVRLFDLSSDLGEDHDLSATRPDRVAALEARLDAWLTDVGAQIPGHR